MLRYSSVRRAGAQLALSLTVFASSAAAQAPRGADTLSGGAIADSQAVLRDLDQKLRTNPKDAALWYRRGMIAWALAERARSKPSVRGLDPTTLGRMADTSLRIAAQVAPDRPQYAIAVGRFLLTPPSLAMSRAAAPGFFELALNVARKGTDSIVWAEAALETGRGYWRNYDRVANRRMELVPGTIMRSISAAMQPMSRSPDEETDSPMYDMRAVREALDRNTQSLPTDVNGVKDYERALQYFREAYAVAPGYPRAFRLVAMALADRSNWDELQTFARKHTESIPWDPWGWLGLGLAAHRLADVRTAGAAFDTAFAYLAGAERERLDHLNRVLPRGDTLKGAAAQRAALAQLYWVFADPLWSRPGNDSRVEYFARVTFAELRWTVDELQVRGADTDRGEIFIRYGPPDITIVAGPDISNNYTDVTSIWVYSTGFIFQFNGNAGYGTARTAPDDIRRVDAILKALPVRWDNIASVKVDSMPTQVSRFRAGGDSVDVYVAAQAPVDSIRKYSDVDAMVRTDLWLVTPATAVVARDSATMSITAAHGWRLRVAPGHYIYRVESSIEGSRRAGRASAQLDAGASFSLHGSGMSDLLLATKVDEGSAAERWTDLKIAPTAGAIPRGGQLVLVWENYEFGSRDSNARYTVAVTLTRVRGLAGSINAAIANISDVSRSTGGEDRVALAFDRTVPHRPAFVDQVVLTLGDTPPGLYTVTLQITDRITNASSSRSRSFFIRR
jgi:GWxTD domain-containing protein